MFYLISFLPIYLPVPTCVLSLLCGVTVLRATYKKTKHVRTKGDNYSETDTLVRVIVRQVFDHPQHNVGSTTADVVAVNRRITLWTSACSAPFCARRRLRFHRGQDYLIMGHVDRQTGHLQLDQRSVIEKWKTRWPAHIQVCGNQ